MTVVAGSSTCSACCSSTAFGALVAIVASRMAFAVAFDVA